MLKQLNLTSNQSVPASRRSSRVRVIGHWTLVISLTTFLALAPCPALASSRVKDIAMVAGARDNQLVGYGLITGIAGDGDKNPVYTLQTVANFLQRFGMNVPPATLSSKNVAAVIVTADISAFKKNGSRVDVTVSSIGDAKTLQGGVLLQTPLVGAVGIVGAPRRVVGCASAGGLGHLEALPPRLQREVATAITRTRDNDRITLNLCFNYGGRDDIVMAVRQLVADGLTPDEVTEEAISERLYSIDPQRP